VRPILAVSGLLCTPKQLLMCLSRARNHKRLAQWKGGQGFAQGAAPTGSSAGGLGQDIRVRPRKREMSGRVQGFR